MVLGFWSELKQETAAHTRPQLLRKEFSLNRLPRGR